MADNLPTSLTVLRPIGFGTIRGPDGTDVNVIPNMADDRAIHIHPDEDPTHNNPHAAKLPKTPGHADFRAPDDFDDDPDVQAIDIGVNGNSSDDDDNITAFSAEELAGRVKANRRGANEQERYDQRVHGRDRDAERKEGNNASESPEDEAKFGLDHRTPVSSSRHVLLDPDMPNTTIAPMSKMKMETFQEVKATLKWKIRGLRVFAACIAIMGIVCVAIGAVAIETAFLYTAFPYVTIVGGVVMLAASPIFAWISKSYKPNVLQVGYFLSGGLGVYMAISGIVAATRPSSDITAEVQRKWYYFLTARTAADDAIYYSADFQERWDNDPQELINTAERHLSDLSIVELISAAILILNMFLLVRISHILQKHLTLTDLATKSKSESNTKQALRQKEVEAYKAAVLADPGNNMALDLEEERIPSSVKVKLAAKAKKYAATTGTEMAEVKKKKKTAGGGGATGSGGDVVPENKKKKHTAAERKEKKARKKARKEAEKARLSQANNGELGPNVAHDDSGSSDSEDDEAVNEAKFKNVVANL